MKRVKETVSLLKEQGRLTWVIWDLMLMAATMTAGIILGSGVLVGFSFLFPVMVCWELSDVRLVKERDELKSQLLDTCDRLCIAEHEVKNLGMELDTYKASAEEEEAVCPVLPQVPQPESSPKPKPKRRPAPKRKPKAKAEE